MAHFVLSKINSTNLALVLIKDTFSYELTFSEATNLRGAFCIKSLALAFVCGLFNLTIDTHTSYHFYK